MSQGTTPASTLNQTPEQGRKWETNRGIYLTVYMVSQQLNLEKEYRITKILQTQQPWRTTCQILFFPQWKSLCDLTLVLCVSDGERGPMPPAQRSAYQRALSMDGKPMGGEVAVGGGLAMRRNVPCPTLVKQEKMDAPIRAGPVPNGFPGGMGVCPPRGNPTSNLNTYLLACRVSVGS